MKYFLLTLINRYTPAYIGTSSNRECPKQEYVRRVEKNSTGPGRNYQLQLQSAVFGAVAIAVRFVAIQFGSIRVYKCEHKCRQRSIAVLVQAIVCVHWLSKLLSTQSNEAEALCRQYSCAVRSVHSRCDAVRGACSLNYEHVSEG